jgi:probable DNA metabolism protein
MLILTYDHSFDGFLTCVFELYAQFDYGKTEATSATIRKSGDYETNLFSEPLAISTDHQKAMRVINRLEKLLGKDGVTQLIWAFLSELNDLENCLLGVITYAIRQPKQNILKNYADPHVMQLAKLVKSVSRERHRMLAFVRFELTHDGIYFARVEPDFNVLPLITQHFRSRYKDQQWAIYDLRRSYGIYYDLTQIHLINDLDRALFNNPGFFADNEAAYQKMWQGYFNHVNIPERVNPRMHVQQLPKRYWRYLTEKKLK